MKDSYDLLYGQLWQINTTTDIKNNTTIDIAAASAPNQVTFNSKTTKVKPMSNKQSTTEPNLNNNADIKLITNWAELTTTIEKCSNCKLCTNRQNVVIERGNRNAKWLFVGEGPGEKEDLSGKPFVGSAGQLLNKMITAMNLDPDNDVYICNVVKCRPPENRNPDNLEIAACKSYLLSQIALVQPKIIITLGRFASQTLLDSAITIGNLRHTVHYYQQIPLIVTYHPAYLLRNPSAKKDSWIDLQLAIATYQSIYDEPK